MPRRLRRVVHLRDDRGVRHVFGPHDELPDWAAARIRNPAAWADTAPTGPPEPEPSPEPPVVSVEQPAVEPADTAIPVPPRSGKGSSRAAWAAYAAWHDIEVGAEWERGDIIEALEHHGIRTE
ncbi:hypothetical protein GCM10009613_61180 [Pseudonocardia kongjuensis]|uniref:Lsr2 protein n=1 Tax=Pseudonocardia kongjuensis TaxID=102227 RepID=A0ABP4IXX8_9PSEU